MLEADVELAIVDLTQLGEPNRERAISVFAADEIAKMLGGQCIFTGVDERWRAAVTEARIPLAGIQIAADLAEALEAARNSANPASTERASGWLARLRRLFR
jgi:hypothetical protein